MAASLGKVFLFCAVGLGQRNGFGIEGDGGNVVSRRSVSQAQHIPAPHPITFKSDFVRQFFAFLAESHGFLRVEKTVFSTQKAQRFDALGVFGDRKRVFKRIGCRVLSE